GARRRGEQSGYQAGDRRRESPVDKVLRGGRQGFQSGQGWGFVLSKGRFPHRAIRDWPRRSLRIGQSPCCSTGSGCTIAAWSATFPFEEQQVTDAVATTGSTGFRDSLRGWGGVGTAGFVVVLAGLIVGPPLAAVLVLLWLWLSRTPLAEVGLARPASWVGGAV